MKKIVKSHQPLEIESLRKLRGYMLGVLRQSRNKIPECPGVYIWRYWPNIKSLSADKLLDTIYKIQNNFPCKIESLANSRVEVSIMNTPFGRISRESLLGIKNDKKIRDFIFLLEKDSSTRLALAHTIEVLVASSPPIYIGKADNLRSRLSEHFDYKTNVLNEIDNAEIPKEDIYISFIADELSEEVISATSTIEEMLQRLTNPTFTKRYG